jgi:hypothetical protein
MTSSLPLSTLPTTMSDWWDCSQLKHGNWSKFMNFFSFLSILELVYRSLSCWCPHHNSSSLCWTEKICQSLVMFSCRQMILNAVPALHYLISISPQIAVWQIIFHSDCLLLRHILGSSFIAWKSWTMDFRPTNGSTLSTLTRTCTSQQYCRWNLQSDKGICTFFFHGFSSVFDVTGQVLGYNLFMCQMACQRMVTK